MTTACVDPTKVVVILKSVQGSIAKATRVVKLERIIMAIARPLQDPDDCNELHRLASQRDDMGEPRQDFTGEPRRNFMEEPRRD